MEETPKKNPFNFIVNPNSENVYLIFRNFQGKKKSGISESNKFGKLRKTCFSKFMGSKKNPVISETFLKPLKSFILWFIIEPSPIVFEDDGNVLIIYNNDEVILNYRKYVC